MSLASEKKILVVDDEPDVRHFISACIEDAGFVVDTAKDGIEALEKIRGEKPDLMTLDMVMPRKSGIQLMRNLRGNDDWADIPVIIITAHAKDEFGADAVKSFNAFEPQHRPKTILEKPIKPEILISTIADILDVKLADGDDQAPDSNIDDKEALKKLIDNSDPDMLKKLQAVLKSGDY